MAALEQFRKAWEGNVALFSAAATWWQGGTARPLNVGYAIGRQTDIAIANALGVGVRTITVRAMDTGGLAPHPLDRLDVAGEHLTINFVTPVVIAGQVAGWRCQCAGQSEFP